MYTKKAIINSIPRWFEQEEESSFEKIKHENTDLLLNLTFLNGNESSLSVEKSNDKVTIDGFIQLIGIYGMRSYWVFPKDIFLNKLRTVILSARISFKILPNSARFEHLYKYYFIYFDEFSRDRLIKEIYKLADTQNLILITWKRFLESQCISDFQYVLKKFMRFMKDHLLIMSINVYLF